MPSEAQRLTQDNNQSSMPVRSVRGSAAAPTGNLTSTFLPVGKGGCWTCRLRRKKCDEQRENGSCQTCLRLKIDCLGWGVRRPDWMRDKAQVEAYKAGIKRQLSSQGMIRGQPRTPAMSAGANMSPMQYQYPITPRGLPLVTGDSDEGDEYVFDHGSANASPSYPPIQMPQLTTGLDLHLYPTPGPHTPPVLPSYNNSPHSMNTGNLPMLPFSVPSQYFPSTAHQNPTPARQPIQPSHPSPSTSLTPETRHQLILYYFRRVRALQFPLASPTLTSTLHDLYTANPSGPVSTALTALGAVHKSHVRISEGLETASSHEGALYAHLYEQAWWQVMSAKQRGRVGEEEATAAVLLVGYWVLGGGGGGEWAGPLAVAGEWLAGLMGGAPGDVWTVWGRLGAAGRFTAQMTMWLDVFSAIGTARAPRFIELYRRLFRHPPSQSSTTSYWPSSPHAPTLHMDHSQQQQQQQNTGPLSISMDTLTGCTDHVFYALAEGAALAARKAAGGMGVRELLARADAVEGEMRAAAAGSGWVGSPELFGGLMLEGYEMGSGLGAPQHMGQQQQQMGGQHHMPPPSRTSSGSSHPSPARATQDLGGSAAVSTPEPTIGAETRQLVANVYFESAVLYLQSVVNDHNPIIREISDAVSSTMSALSKLALSEVDRGLVFPICLAGCLTDVPEHRAFFKARLDSNSSLGNLGEVRRLMEMVWGRRDTQGGAADWRAAMPDLGVSLLVV